LRLLIRVLDGDCAHPLTQIAYVFLHIHFLAEHSLVCYPVGEALLTQEKSTGAAKSRALRQGDASHWTILNLRSGKYSIQCRLRSHRHRLWSALAFINGLLRFNSFTSLNRPETCYDFERLRSINCVSLRVYCCYCLPSRTTLCVHNQHLPLQHNTSLTRPAFLPASLRTG
jgi:hypothetical protein